jgi:hypothetical protein
MADVRHGTATPVDLTRAIIDELDGRVLSEVTRLTKSPTHRSANVRRPLWSIAGWRPDQRLFSGRSPAYPVRTTSALSVGSVTPAASETGQGFGHTVTLRFPAGISHVRRLLIRPSLQRSHRRKPAPLGRQLLWTGIRHRLLRRCPCRPAGQPTAVADARYAACHRGNFPFRPPRRDAKRLALHRCLAPETRCDPCQPEGRCDPCQPGGRGEPCQPEGLVNLASRRAR